MIVRIGHQQCVCHPGDFDRNLQTVVAGLQRAAELQIAIQCFPEVILGGYWRRREAAWKAGWPLDSPETRELLRATAPFDSTALVGFNERRGDDLYDTVLVIRRGELRGSYSKCWPAMPYFTPSRATPVFDHDGVTFGVLICADGGYVEPARLLVMKGARILFAPHYNYIAPERLIDHYVHVRSDHVARAVENGVFFVRGNNVEVGEQPSLESSGVGYGDSYILDPNGQVIAAAGLHDECLIWADVDLDRRYWAGPNKNGPAALAFWEQYRDLSAV
ncbi:MAG: hypothetical protein IT204_07590 [Fimbriimonadaceae bacterium]|nr:hypothetical protein [Fimbriimonadaceae bacterium]